MGLGHSSQPGWEVPTQTEHAQTFSQFLATLSEKVDELKQIVNNMQNGPMEESIARPYLAKILEQAKDYLASLEYSFSSKAYGQGQQYTRTSKQTQQRPYSQMQFQNQYIPRKETGDLPSRLESAGTRIVELESENYQCKEQKKIDTRTIDELSQKCENYKTELSRTETEKNKLKEEIKKLDTEKKELLYRLSKLTGDKLTSDNPNIADLSDPNRPTKLAEMMSELYDNEWTDAFEALKPCKQNDEKVVVKVLLDTFMDVFRFCKTKSGSLVSLSEKSVKHLFEDFNETLKVKDRIARTKSTTVLARPDGKAESDFSMGNILTDSGVIFIEWRGKEDKPEDEERATSLVVENVWPKLESELKKVRKDFGVAMIPIVTKAYLKPRWSKSCVIALKPYIKRCLHVAWLMCVQTPPMSIATLPQHGDEFNADLYTVYQTRGQKIDYAVWPALLLKELESPTEKPILLRKGSAAGKGT